ncbi:3-phenylpropionate/cinnamic acid dioxygenase, small subunit [Streptoalloteichus tenebrarius]|uniref:3-phenylpropionate/cinnamic acid dioxygenase, small subunit n=1 Tax=Streptoalloteichus tenebrarius (strain ATCC 17920 / DSM 40477 / JCM 4838 / CBS 697.72 / NBRC 16177 / NCIMB 11028 / NRRL B-12390 / A12253. 1 / ISP 5477) TaxID=1933 RepID=A0ABT1I483_STRSD|nr:nuclear transport factor 2 family protein [Streptoalloteichus tenebrarius]MCP2262597.1 3-phenylpropionate/cinnamic acid dioxygenase, small subunit [Streptoalloteichus tenebrarius]BFF02992.1 hypothetical protein GCM10020241_46670 [Streptoalloteichus tenebrarius]
MSAPDVVATPVAGELYHEVHQFYAQQMYLLDEHDVDGWVNTFAEDGVFVSNGLPEPLRGHAELLPATRAGADRRDERGVVHRHLMTMLAVWERSDGTLLTRAYVLVVETGREQPTRTWANTVIQDVLARRGDSWVVLERRIALDRKGHASSVLPDVSREGARPA